MKPMRRVGLGIFSCESSTGEGSRDFTGKLPGQSKFLWGAMTRGERQTSTGKKFWDVSLNPGG